jgi:hypothetical protein
MAFLCLKSGLTEGCRRIKMKEHENETLVIEITATVDNPGLLNPSIAIHEAFRGLGGMNLVFAHTVDKQSKAESPKVSLKANWRYEKTLTDEELNKEKE